VNAFVRGYAMVSRRVVGLYLRLLYRFEVLGLEHVPETGGVLLVSNHQSFLDPPIIQVAIPRLVVFTPRATLHRSWLYRLLTQAMATVPLKRGSADLSATKRLLGLLEEGEAVALFPEQTRTPDGKLGAIKGGFHLLAARSRVPVVPLAILGAYDVWPKGHKLPRLRGHIEVHIGPPIGVADCSREVAIARLEDAWRKLGA
jgi:1-acyl-sn-glycerol-3-phosphate acyltransferase